MDWTRRPVARALLEETNAFLTADDAEDRGLQLLDPITHEPAIISRWSLTPDRARTENV